MSFYRNYLAFNKHYLIIILLTSLHMTNGQDPNACTTPANQPGRCVSYQMCPVIADVLTNAPKPLPDAIVQYLRMSYCGNDRGVVKLCCPGRISDTQTTTGKTVSGSTLLNGPQCGLSQSDRISNGNKTNLSEYPWMALLEYDGINGRQFQCGGTLISKRYILTAAHCLVGTKSQLVSVRLGEHDLSQKTDCSNFGNQITCAPPVEDIGIESVSVHPEYNKPRYSNDIGLIRLRRNVEFEDKSHINTVCLPLSSSSQNRVLTRFITTGWGTTETGRTSQVLLKATLRVEPNDVCQNIFKRSILLNSNQMCAKGADGVDTCQGDSGGPVVYPGTITENHIGLIQYGVVSAGGVSCGGSNTYPGIYTKVVPYIDWITNEIKP